MDSFISFLAGGLTQASWWQVLLYTLVTTHITIAAVTIFLHRSQAHRGLDLHPIVSHFFRFWLWIGTGMVTKQWVSIHRKHHAKCEREGDPHSPMVYGIGKVFFEGAELYRSEAINQETLDRFGHGTPNDWIEKNLYSRYTVLGVSLMLILNVALFGVVGLSVWAIQMVWIPFWAAGVVNGIGHFWGYRNFASPDTSRNVFPIGIIIGGEELHNNHHAYASSARFSSKWYEFDIGWVYIRGMELVGLAKVKKVAPKLELDDSKIAMDLGTLQAVITHRYEIMARYADLLKQSCLEEIKRLQADHQSCANLSYAQGRLHQVDDDILPEASRDRIKLAIKDNSKLSALVDMQRDLSRLWERSTASSEQLLKELQDWCSRAQQSGNERLIAFAHRLKTYAPTVTGKN